MDKIQNMRFIDIGVNLTDGMFRGVYHGSKKHEDDLESVISRAKDIGMEKMIVTGGSLDDSKEAIALAKTRADLYCTVGCHPTRCTQFADDPERYKRHLQELIDGNRGKVVAVGECGLDYDRLHFCDKDTQMKYFVEQLSLAESTRLPLFLHMRACGEVMLPVLASHRHRFTTAVVHSFDGSAQDVKDIVSLDLYIGINGCSLKTARNLEVIKTIPLNRILIETDAPWCEIRPSHSSHQHLATSVPPTSGTCKKERFQPGMRVKGRNEPANITQVLEVLSQVLAHDQETLSERIYQNTMECFFNNNPHLT